MHNEIKISDSFYYIGGSDRRLALFENVYPLENGASYNSYLYLDEKTLVLDTVRDVHEPVPGCGGLLVTAARTIVAAALIIVVASAVISASVVAAELLLGKHVGSELVPVVDIQGEIVEEVEVHAEVILLGDLPFQAAVDDLKVSFGQLAAGALTPAVQILTYLARAAYGCTAWFSSLNGTSKAYLKVALLLGAAIPAVALATKGLALAQAGLHAVQALLIPQTLTYAAALKALLGWAALAAVAFGLLHALFSRNKDTESAADTMDDYNKSVEDTQKNANKAAGSIEDMTKATKGLTDEVQRSLASFDELNRLGDNNTNLIGIDNESIEKAAEAMGAFSDMDYDISYDTNVESVSTRIKNALKNIWTETKKGYSDWTSWWEGLGEDMYTGIEEGNWEPFLSRLNENVKILFGDKWADFWEKAGENMYTGIKDGDWTPLLEQFDDLVRKVFGDGWTDFWERAGDDMYEGIENGDWVPLLEDADRGVGRA